VIPKPLDAYERSSMITLLKMVWFLVTTAGRFIKNGDPDIKLCEKQANALDKNLDNYLKDL